MALTPADPAIGGWIGSRLAEFGPRVGAIVPQGFEAYARILHPAQLDAEEWLTWDDVARRAGTTLDAVSAWWRVCGARSVHDAHDHAALDPLAPDLQAPPEGSLPEHLFGVLLELLAAGSDADAPCVSAVWNGWGYAGGGRATFGWGPDGEPLRDPPAPPTGPYPAEVLDGPLLSLPQREYYTFACTLATADGPSRYDVWRTGDGAGWQSPQLLWPADRSWCVATEVDFDSTLVGGPEHLITAILAEPRLESFRVSASDTITYE